jgi:hypothetical protein
VIIVTRVGGFLEQFYIMLRMISLGITTRKVIYLYPISTKKEG